MHTLVDLSAILHQCANGKFQINAESYRLEPLALFFVKIIKSPLNDIPIYLKRYTHLQELSESANAVLNCFKDSPEKRIQVSEISKQVDLPRRTIQYALKKLVEKKLINRLGKGAGSRYQLIF